MYSPMMRDTDVCLVVRRSINTALWSSGPTTAADLVLPHLSHPLAAMLFTIVAMCFSGTTSSAKYVGVLCNLLVQYHWLSDPPPGYLWWSIFGLWFSPLSVSRRNISRLGFVMLFPSLPVMRLVHPSIMLVLGTSPGGVWASPLDRL